MGQVGLGNHREPAPSPEARLNELRRDYEAMLPMFIGEPDEFDQMMSVLRDAEETLNRA